MKRSHQRLAALLLGLLLAVVVLEVALHVLRPGLYERPVLKTPDGQAADLSSVIGFLGRTGADPAVTTSMTRLPPHMSMLGCYDRPAWDYFDADGCIEYQTDSLGFRDDEFPQQRPPDEYRVLALGDSFTFGLGVRQQDAWPQVLERRLAEQRGGAVQVVNVGFAAGHLPPHYTSWMSQKGLLLDPQLVIVGLCLNDMGPVPMLAYHKDIEGTGIALVDIVFRMAVDHVERNRTPPLDLPAAIKNDPTTWEHSRRALLELQTLLSRRKIGLVVAVLPMLSELQGSNPFAPLHGMVTTFCRENGIEVVDLLPMVEGRVERDLWVHPTDQHPNAVGQALLADGIFEYLRKRDG